MKYFKILCLLLTVLYVRPLPLSGQTSQDLQELINNPSTLGVNTSGQYLIDLSRFNSDCTKPIIIRNGRKYLLSNGTLRKSTEGWLGGPLLIIGDNSEVELGTDGVIDGNGLLKDNYDEEVVLVESSGELNITGGYITGKRENANNARKMLPPTHDIEVFVNIPPAIISYGRVNIKYGEVSSIYNEGNLRVKGNVTYIACQNAGMTLWGESNIGFINMTQTSQPIILMSALQSDVTIYGNQDQHIIEKDMIPQLGYGPNGGFIVVPSYRPSEADVTHIKTSRSLHPVLENEDIYLRGNEDSPNDDLQDFIDNSKEILVDLSKFTATKRTKSLIVNRNVAFINGTLSRASSEVGPVLIIKSGSVDVYNGATITGSDKLHYDEPCEIVRIENGVLRVEGGEVVGAYENARQQTPKEGEPPTIVYQTGWGDQDPSIRMEKYAELYLLSGTIYGDIYCDSEDASLVFLGGELKTVNLWNDNGHQKSRARIPNKLSASGWVDAKIVSCSPVYIQSTIPYADKWGIVVDSPFSSVGDGFNITLLGKSNFVCLYNIGKQLYTSLRINAPDKTEGDLLLSARDYNITEGDKKLVSLYTINEWGEDESEYDLELKDNSLYLCEKKYTVCDSDDLDKYINNLGSDKGTAEDPSEISLCEEPTLDTDVDIDEDDIQLLIDGTGKNPPISMSFHGGTINLNKTSCGLSLKQIILTGPETSTTSRNGDLKGGITSVGKLSFSGCTLKAGDYVIENKKDGIIILKDATIAESQQTIFNSGNLITDGSCNIKGIINKYNGRIYLTHYPQYDLHVIVNNIDDIELNVPIIAGIDGFTLYEYAANRISMSLPHGYMWKYDSKLKGIIITYTSDISNIKDSHVEVVGTYDATGRKVSNHYKGLTIQRLSNGSVKKSF